jgi:hypothetical protein
MTVGSQAFVRAIGILAAMSAGLAAFVPPARSDARLCGQLEAELAGGAPRPALNTAKYDVAISKQRDQIVRVRNRSQAAGCGFSSTRGNAEDCASLNANLARMQSNLDSLERKRADLTQVAPDRPQDQILAELDANSCREEAYSYPLEPTTDGAYNEARTIDQILNEARAHDEAEAAQALDERVRRVLNSGDDTASPGFEIIAGTHPQPGAGAMATDPTQSSSIVRPEVPAAPVAKALGENHLVSHEPSPERDLDPNRKVRVVGPVFLPDPEAAINLRAPARRAVP